MTSGDLTVTRGGCGLRGMVVAATHAPDHGHQHHSGMDRSRQRRTGTPSGAGGPWWAMARTLVERVRAAGSGDPTGAAPPSETARLRLQQWRTAHGLAATGQFAVRLANLGVTEGQLLAMLDRPTWPAIDVADSPEWVQFVERALALAPDLPVAIAADIPWNAAFGRVFAPLIEIACADLRRQMRAVDIPGVLDPSAVTAAFADGLRARLVAMASRTLVLELNLAREAGQLAGPTPEHRFAAFVTGLSGRARLTALFVDYPVLARILATACRHATEAAAELTTRFVADRDEILQAVLAGQDPGLLTGFEVVGDLHGRGRAVTILQFTSGVRLVYRPRPVTAHTRFNVVLDWLNCLLPDLQLRTLSMLERSGYGWIELVDPAHCANAGQVGLFYHRQGALLAVLYLLGMTDVHRENVLACGDQPVLVDVETLLHPDLPVPGAVPDPAARALRASVYRTALLPRPFLGERGVLDFSGLGGDPVAQQFLDTVDWSEPGTDRMRLVRRATSVGRGENRPTLQGVPADAADYSTELLAGFRAVYHAVAGRRDELAGPDGLLQRFSGVDLRVIPRPTQIYAVLLTESTHPDVLRDALDREQIFDLLWAASVRDQLRNQLVRHEITQLWDGDIPVFTGCPDSRDLTGGDGFPLVGVLAESGLVAARRKIGSMAAIDQRDQEWVIRAALAARLGGARHECAEPTRVRREATAPDPGRLLAVACGIADAVISDAYDDGNVANWLGLEPVDERHSTVLPLGAGLATGYPGVALFLAELARLTGVGRYAETAAHAARQLPVLLAALSERPDVAGEIGSGGFVGLGGMAYSAARLAALLGDAALGDCVETAVRLAGLAVTTETGTGMFDGLAGCLAAMLSVNELTGLPLAAVTARECAERLLTVPAPTRSGFATGAAGVGWALLRFADATADERCGVAGTALLARAAQDPTGPESAHTWCHGLPGIAAAVADRGESLADPVLATVVDRVAAGIPSSGLLRDHSLCHGELGRQEVLTIAAAQGRPAALTARIVQAGQLLADLDHRGPRCGVAGGVVVPGLLDGLAGIGYGLLRAGFADQVPSVLLLQAEPTRTPRNGAEK